MNLKAFFKGFAIHTCIYATAVFSAAMLFCALGGMTSFAIATYFLILALCACLAAGNAFMMQSGIKIGYRVGAHALLALGGFYLCIILRYRTIDSGVTDQTLTVLFFAVTLLYAAIMLAFLLIRNARRKKQERLEFEKSRSLTPQAKERRNHKK